MRHALFRKAKADILGRPFTTLLLGLVIAVGAATLAMTLTVHRSTSTSYEAFLEEARGGHVWVFSSLELLDEVRRTGPGIAVAGNPMPSLDNGRMLGASAEHRLSFFGVGAEPPAIAPALIVEGRWPEEGSNQAVIDRGFAQAEELAIGDEIRVTASGGVTALQIVGLHVPTNLAPYPVWTTSSVFVSPDLVADLGGGAPAYYSAGYELLDPDRSAAFVQTLAIRFRDSPPSMRDWQEVRAVVIEENEETFFLLGSFAFFALLAALFIIANAVAGQVQSQLRDIGLLKAIGVTPRQVTLLFVLELALIALLASGLGVVLGWWITPVFLADLEEMLGLPAPVSPNAVELASTIGVATSISALAALTAG